MSQANVEVVKEAFDALRREDWVAVAGTIADDCEVHDFDIPDAAGEVYRGPDGVLDWLAEFDRAWASWSVVDEVFRSAPDGRVIALFRLATRGRESGIEMGRDDAIVYVVRDGKISRIEYYNDQQAALQAIGLSELGDAQP
jgi:ketosteroid isomerase-like protein